MKSFYINLIFNIFHQEAVMSAVLSMKHTVYYDYNDAIADGHDKAEQDFLYQEVEDCGITWMPNNDD